MSKLYQDENLLDENFERLFSPKTRWDVTYLKLQCGHYYQLIYLLYFTN